MISLVTEATKRTPWIKYLGRKDIAQVYAPMGRACFVVFPSELYETFGRVIIETYSKVTPRHCLCDWFLYATGTRSLNRFTL